MSQNQRSPGDGQHAILKDERTIRLDIIVKYSLVLIAIVVFFWAVFHARAFLIPLTFAAILAMMLVPINQLLEKWGWSRMWSSLTSVLLLVVLVGGLIFLLSTQANNFASNFSTIRQQVMEKYQALQQTVEEQWRLSLPDLDVLLGNPTGSARATGDVPEDNRDKFNATTENDADSARSSQSRRHIEPEFSRNMTRSATNQGSSDVSASWLSSIANPIAQWISSLMSTFGDIVLTLVYIFSFLYYRDKFQEFLLRMTSEKDHETIAEIINDTSGVARKYLWGRIILIFVLVILYSIGFLVIGLEHALFLALTASIFTFIPYIGPFIGIAFPVLVGIASQDAATLLIGILAVYLVAQFVESYILEPLIVGGEVDVNPFFTILAVVIGGLMWGIPGMILGIPLLGIARIIFDHIEPLRLYAFLLGEEKKEGKLSKIVRKQKAHSNQNQT